MPPIALPPNRRTIAAIAVLIVVLTAGCVAMPASGGSSDADVSPTAQADPADADLVEYAPAGTDVLYHVDGEILRDDELFATIDGAAAANGDERSIDSQARLELYASQAGVDLNSFDEALVFGEYGLGEDEASGGVLVRGSWSEDQLVGLLDRLAQGETTYQTTTYAGATVYSVSGEDDEESLEIGVVGDGLYAVGTAQSVRDVLDVAAGDRESVSGPVRSAYDGHRDGLVTAAAAVPDRVVDEVLEDADAPIGSGALRDLEAVSTVSYTPEGRLGSATSLHFSDEQSAAMVGLGLDAVVGLGTAVSDDEAAEVMLEHTTIETDGTTVSMRQEIPVETYVELITSSSDHGY